MGRSSKKTPSKLHKASARTSKLSTKPSLHASSATDSPKEISISEEPDVPKGQQLSKGQRKRQAKRMQYLKRERLIQSSLSLRRKSEPQDAMAVDSLKDAIGVVDASTKNMTTSRGNHSGHHFSSKRVKSNRGKKRLQNEEVMHMSLVLQHPQFKEDPFGTLQEHLKNSVASNYTRTGGDATTKGNKKKHR